MRARLVVLALSIASSSFACAGARDTVQLAGAGDALHLHRVVLYENGLAHFERRGRAAQSSVDLVVPAAQVDDVLRSLTIVDEGASAITGVRILAADRAEDVTLRVGLTREGARDLRISYVTEAPGWRPTYRIVVGADDRVHVQGLAVVDNPTSEPWQDVALTLSTEVPLSFRFDLREARVAQRPHFGSDGRLIRDPVAEDDAEVASAVMQPRAEINVAYGLAQRSQPEASTRAGTRVGDRVGAVDPSGATAPPSGSTASALLAFEDRPEASGGVFGEVAGFDLGRGESGLVPFVDTGTEGRLALVYKPSPGGALSQEHPYRAVLFRNPSDAALLTGPVAIYAGERFVGDGVTGAIPARAHAFVPFALERTVRVERGIEDAEDEVRATSLAGGVLTVEVRAVHRERFVMTATAPITEPAFAFAPSIEGYTPRELPEGTIVTGQGYFVPITLGGDGRGEAVLDLLRRTTASINVASSPDHGYVPALLALLGEGQDVARLREIADRLVVVRDEVARVEEDLRVERGALEERRSALDALRTVSSGAALRARLAGAVAQGVGRVDALTTRSTALHAEDIALRQEWYGRLRALTLASR